MALIYQSTLNEVEICLRDVCYGILNKLLPQWWQHNGQIVYSTVDDWDTAYRMYLEYNKIPDVKFPFGTLTRETTQVTQRPFGTPYRFTQAQAQEGDLQVKGGIIKPVRCTFNLTLYTRQMGSLEMFADFIIAQGYETQRFDYQSEVLDAPSRFSFQFDEPTHAMLPDKAEKLQGKGHIYSLTVPIIVDTVLGIGTTENLIGEVISEVIINNSQVESVTITTEDC